MLCGLGMTIPTLQDGWWWVFLQGQCLSPGRRNLNFSPRMDQSHWPPHRPPGLHQRRASGPWADVGVRGPETASRRLAAIQHPPETQLRGTPLVSLKHSFTVSGVSTFVTSPPNYWSQFLQLHARLSGTKACGLDHPLGHARCPLLFVGGSWVSPCQGHCLSVLQTRGGRRRRATCCSWTRSACEHKALESTCSECMRSVLLVTATLMNQKICVAIFKSENAFIYQTLAWVVQDHTVFSRLIPCDVRLRRRRCQISLGHNGVSTQRTRLGQMGKVRAPPTAANTAGSAPPPHPGLRKCLGKCAPPHLARCGPYSPCDFRSPERRC